MNGRLWNSGIKSDENVARQYKARKNYYANILVVSDPANKANEGKVFLFRFGPKIYEFIESCIAPKFPGEEPTYPYDFWAGRNFVIKMSMNGEFISYEKSTMEAVSELYPGDDDKKEQVWKQCHSLTELLSDKHFKPYEDLAKRLRKVLGESIGSGVRVIEAAEGAVQAPVASAPVVAPKPAVVAATPPTAPANAFAEKVRQEATAAPKPVVAVADDEMDSLFKSLADD